MLQFFLSGVSIGAIYGLLGLALALSFYVTRVINFAQGQMLTIAIFVAASLSEAGYGLWIDAYHGYLPQKEAIDGLGRELGFTVLSLPTGGGMIVKQQQNVEIDAHSVSSSPRPGGLLDRQAHWLGR